MSIWGRLMSTFNGARTGWNLYSARSLYPRIEWGWNDYASRLSRYNVYQAYFDNSIYSSLESFSERLKVDERLYKHVRGIYNPIKRENDLYAANVYQGQINLTDLGAGALPLEYDNPALEDPLRLLLKWSNLGQNLTRYVSDTANLGDSAWWIVDDPARQRVRLELLNPSKIRDVALDEVGNVRACVIEYEREENPDVERYQPRRFGTVQQQVKTYVYTLKAEKRDDETVHFETFYDGKPHAYTTDADGTPLLEWDANYPFVPLKLAAFEPTEDGWGRNSWYASRRKIDELNDQAALLNDSVRRVIEPILKATNVSAGRNADGTQKQSFETQRDERSGITVLFVNGENANIEPLTIPLDIGSSAENIKSLLDEIERDMPVLALQRIRDSGAVSGAAVRSMYGDAIGRIDGARKNLDPPLAMALQMGVTIGAVRGYDGFEDFDAESYDRGEMDLQVKERPVMPDELPLGERLTAYHTVKDLPPSLQRRALLDMGVPSAEVDEIVAESSAQQERETRAAARELANTVFGDEDEDEGADEDTEEREAEAV